MNKINLAGCVILKKNSLLLLHRIKTDWYELPGGKIDEHETSEQAAIRELKEELLCDVTIIRRLGEKDFLENGYKMGYTWLLATLKSNQEPSIGEPDKFSDYRYIPLEKLMDYPLSLNMKNFAQELADNKITLP